MLDDTMKKMESRHKKSLDLAESWRKDNIRIARLATKHVKCETAQKCDHGKALKELIAKSPFIILKTPMKKV